MGAWSIESKPNSDWLSSVERINKGLTAGLSRCQDYQQVVDVRTLGAIGVVELKEAVDMKSITGKFVDAGVWVRPFGKLVYLMPPYVINDEDLSQLCNAICKVVGDLPQ